MKKNTKNVLLYQIDRYNRYGESSFREPILVKNVTRMPRRVTFQSTSTKETTDAQQRTVVDGLTLYWPANAKELPGSADEVEINVQTEVNAQGERVGIPGSGTRYEVDGEAGEYFWPSGKRALTEVNVRREQG